MREVKRIVCLWQPIKRSCRKIIHTHKNNTHVLRSQIGIGWGRSTLESTPIKTYHISFIRHNTYTQETIVSWAHGSLWWASKNRSPKGIEEDQITQMWQQTLPKLASLLVLQSLFLLFVLWNKQEIAEGNIQVWFVLTLCTVSLNCLKA